MPNTKSAARRVRQTARRETINRSTRSRLKTLESDYLETVRGGNKANAAETLKKVTSALDKATKTGVVNRGTASRKKSRLTLRFNALS